MWKKWWKYLHYNEHLVIPKTKIRRKFELNKARNKCVLSPSTKFNYYTTFKYKKMLFAIISVCYKRDDDNASKWLISSKEFKYKKWDIILKCLFTSCTASFLSQFWYIFMKNSLECFSLLQFNNKRSIFEERFLHKFLLICKLWIFFQRNI